MSPEIRLHKRFKQFIAPIVLVAGLVLAGCDGQNTTNSSGQPLQGENPSVLPNNSQPDLSSEPLSPPTSPVLEQGSSSAEILQAIAEGVTDNGAALNLAPGQTFQEALDLAHQEGHINLYQMPNGEVYMGGPGVSIFAEGPLGLSALSALTQRDVLAQLLNRSSEQPELGELYDFLLSGNTVNIFSSEKLNPEMKQVLARQGYHIQTVISTIIDDTNENLRYVRELTITNNQGLPIFYMKYIPTELANRYNIIDIQPLSTNEGRSKTDVLTVQKPSKRKPTPGGFHRHRG